ncbi:MAG: hypothetical protein ACJ74O_19645 [Frankiaceae bacterium]
MLEDMFCVICRTEMPFEQPPCADGHDADCAEWVCTACGAAMLRGQAPAVVAVSTGIAAA